MKRSIFFPAIVVLILASFGVARGDEVHGRGYVNNRHFVVDAFSSPTGDYIAGFVIFPWDIYSVGMRVSQLCVSGNTAVIAGPVMDGPSYGKWFALHVADNTQTGTPGQIRPELLDAPTAVCPAFNLESPLQVSDGYIVVIDTDAPPPPPPPPAPDNLVINGSFEAPSIPTSTFETFVSIQGWSSSGCELEVQNRVAGNPLDGNQHLELDSWCSSTAYQDVPTEPGGVYALSFGYSPRPGIEDNRITVQWDGTPVVTLDLNGIGLNETTWYYYHLIVPAAAGSTRLEFADAGHSDTFGGYIDDVSVKSLGVLPDYDDDGVLNTSDNCPLDGNPDQADNDLDGLGDACDADDDNDNVGDSLDNCPFVPNPGQSDADGDGQGDACESDPDGDGVVSGDNCPLVPNADQADTDYDGDGDACDADDDNDGADDAHDNCPAVANPDQRDLDGDNVGDACDIDADGDGVANDLDNCPVTGNVGQDDTDRDDRGDACDPDDDNDGLADGADNCSLSANPDQADADEDGQGDSCDGDLDGDGIANEFDNCPFIANENQNDFDLDGGGDACDQDLDNDGVANSADVCDFTPLAQTIDPATGCSLTELCPCSGPRGTTMQWKNQGQYISCMAKSAANFVLQVLMTEEEKGQLVSEAAQSGCGGR